MIHKITISTVVDNNGKKVVSTGNITQDMIDAVHNKDTVVGEFFNIFFNKQHMNAVQENDNDT